MIQLPIRDLDIRALRHLENVQQRIDNKLSFTEQVKKADSEWTNKLASITKLASFTTIKDTLKQMCVGVELCNYCENNEATDIEHIFPKSIYPNKAFQWGNYLLACKNCNSGHKLNKFAVFDAIGSATYIDLDGTDRPNNEDCVLIHPRIDNPLNLFWLDIQNKTFHFVPYLGLSARDLQKAKYTLNLLKLNERASLVAARKRAANFYVDRLERYVKVKNTQNLHELENTVPEFHHIIPDQSFADEKERLLVAIRQDILDADHPTVWKELIRQRDSLPLTGKLLLLANEATSW